MLQELLNGLLEDGWELKQIIELQPGMFTAIMSSKESFQHKTSFGPLEWEKNR